GHALPPDTAVGSQSYIGKDRVLSQRRHSVGVGLGAGARGDTEETRLRVDSPKLARLVGLDPRDVVVDSPYLPALEAGRRDHHREVCLATGRGESSGDIGLFCGAVRTLRRLNRDDQHVFRHPALIAGDVGGDAESKTLFAQQRIAAIARAVAPDLASLRKMHDVLRVVAGPGN